MSASTSRPAVVASISYRDPIPAMRWLELAFGFETTTLITDPQGRIAYAEMAYLDAPFGVMNEWESEDLLGQAKVRSPASTEGAITGFFRVSVPDLDAHHERARAAGARITQAPKDQFYGERTYRALDLEGHLWNFTQPVERLTSREVAQRGDLTIRKAPEETA